MNKELTHRNVMSPLENLGYSLFNSFFNDPLMNVMKPIGTIHGVESHDSDTGREYFYTLPGIPHDALDVHVEGDILMVEILKKDDSHMENVKSRVSLPEGADVERIEATYENGILKVTVPFMEKEKRTIKVNFPEPEKVLESSN